MRMPPSLTVELKMLPIMMRSFPRGEVAEMDETGTEEGVRGVVGVTETEDDVREVGETWKGKKGVRELRVCVCVCEYS